MTDLPVLVVGAGLAGLAAARRLVAGGAAAASELVPDQVLRDVAVEPDAGAMRARVGELGIGAMAIPAHTIDEVGERVAFARSLLA